MSLTGAEFLALGAVFAVAAWVIIVRGTKKRQSVFMISARILLTALLLGILTITVLGRQPYEGVHLRRRLFWSYRSQHTGDTLNRICTNGLNVLMFVPLGAALPLSRQKKTSLLQCLLFGLCLSVSIELLQMVTKRGCFEYDDLFHNTAGMLLGWGLVRLLRGRRGAG